MTEQQHMVKTVTLTVDGVEVTVPEGTLVIRAAERLGIQIPRFCDHPLLDPVGACRQCLVEVPDAGNGRPIPKPQASCTLPAADGMVVRTQKTSPVADKAQQGIMEFLLINHPLDCPVCDKGGECPLQNQAMTNGRGETRFLDVKRTFPKPINISAQVLLDRERCVLCARCTRFSDQIAGDRFIELLERGSLQQVGIYEKEPFESYFSGNTIQICPVGALTSAGYRFRARPFDLVSAPTVCEHCASGCALRTDHRRGLVMRRLAGNDPEVNEEWNCDRGRFGFMYARTGDRLDGPLVRDEETHELRPASWSEAFVVAARGLARAGAATGVLTGGRLTAEDAYAYSRFARAVLGTNNIDFRARPASDEELQFLASQVVTRRTVSYRDLERATAVVLVGFEPEDESPIVFLRLRKAARAFGLRVYSIASHTSAGLHKMSGRLLRTPPGAEVAAVRAVATDPEIALDAGGVILVGERMAAVPGALSAVAELAETTGARLAWVPRRAGERSALEAGALPGLLPGGRPVEQADARVDVSAAWGVDTLASIPGLTGDQMLAAAASGSLRALVVAGVEVDDLPDPAAARVALDALEFLVSVEVRESEVTRRADVVLPVGPMAERPGTFVDWEGRPRPFERAIVSQALTDVRVLAGVATEMGRPLGFSTVEEARADMVELGPWDGPRSGLERQTVVRSAEPAPSSEALRPAGVSDGARPPRLSPWRNLFHAARGVDGDEALRASARQPVAVLSAATLQALGVLEGGAVCVATHRGTALFPATAGDIGDDGVWLPANSAGLNLRRDLGVGAGDSVWLEAEVTR